MPHFVTGARRFLTDVFPSKRSLFERLSGGQEPEALFITCSDSRIEPAMITQTKPGELFVVRNAGNLVPPYGAEPNATSAAIEYSIAILGVRHAVVCGHTSCGAMGAIGSEVALDALPELRGWLDHAVSCDDAPDVTDGGLGARVRWLAERNVVTQLEHLQTHPVAAAALAEGILELHGWLYDIRTGEIWAWQAAEDRFVPLPDDPPEVLADDADE